MKRRLWLFSLCNLGRNFWMEYRLTTEPRQNKEGKSEKRQEWSVSVLVYGSWPSMGATSGCSFHQMCDSMFVQCLTVEWDRSTDRASFTWSRIRSKSTCSFSLFCSRLHSRMCCCTCCTVSFLLGPLLSSFYSCAAASHHSWTSVLPPLTLSEAQQYDRNESHH